MVDSWIMKNRQELQKVISVEKKDDSISIKIDTSSSSQAINNFLDLYIEELVDDKIGVYENNILSILESDIQKIDKDFLQLIYFNNTKEFDNNDINKIIREKIIITGKVKKIESFGLFIDFKNIKNKIGLIHYNEISHEGPVDASKIYKIGDEVKFNIIHYDTERNVLALSIKATQKDLWSELDIGSIIQVSISEITDFGAYVTLKNGKSSILLTNEISWDTNVKDNLSVGEKINVQIIEKDYKRNIFFVSKKRLLQVEFSEKYSEGDSVKGIISHIEDFGVFVVIDDLVEALIRDDDLGYLVKSNLNIGQTIEASIVKIDNIKDRHRLKITQLNNSLSTAKDKSELIQKKENKMIVVTEDGKKIILNTDGTWEEYKEIAPSNTKFDVRKANWGMNQIEVKSTENIVLIADEEATVAYEGKLNNHACLIAYRFHHNELSSMDYIFQHTYSDDSKFINDFEMLKDTLTNKYGKPTENTRHFFSETYQDIYSDWAMALSTGELSFFTTWIVNKTKILLALYGDNYEVSFILSYIGTEYENSIEEADKQNLLDDL